MNLNATQTILIVEDSDDDFFATERAFKKSGLRNPVKRCVTGDQALDYLDKDRAFLTKGGVFTDTYLDAYIDLKMQEVTRFRMATHPVEFDMYYTL